MIDLERDFKDEELIDLIQVGKKQNACIKELVSRHSGIYLSIIHSYVHKSTSSLIKEDLIDDKDFRIYQAALKFDKSKKSKFSTFLGNETKWMCLNLHNKNKNKISVEFQEESAQGSQVPQDTAYSYLNADDREFFSRILDITKRHPDKRVEKIFEMRYIQGNKNTVMPWRLISEKLNLSIQGCINIHNSAILNIKQKLLKEV